MQSNAPKSRYKDDFEEVEFLVSRESVGRTLLTLCRAKAATAKSSRRDTSWKSGFMLSRKSDCCRPIMSKRFCAKCSP